MLPSSSRPASTAHTHVPSWATARPVAREELTADRAGVPLVAPILASSPRSLSCTAIAPPSTLATAAATSGTSAPRSTRSASRSWASSARRIASLFARMTSLASLRSRSATLVSSSRCAVSSAMAAWSASEDSRATSSGGNCRVVRFAAYSTPITRLPSVSGTPRIATSPSSFTAVSIGVVWSNRRSAK